MRRVLVLIVGLLLVAPGAAGARTLENGIADDRALFADPSVANDWAAAGVDVVRIHARWDAIAPDRTATVPPAGFHFADPDDPLYSWGALDRAIAAVRGAGMRVMLAVTGPGPVWASSAPSRHDGRWKPVPAHFRAFATAVATRYGADVDRYLIWNEPNHPLWLTPQRSGGRPVAPGVYRDLVNAAVPAIHDADPGSEVVMGTLAPSGSSSSGASAPLRPLTFLRAFACVDRRYHRLRGGSCRGFVAPAADGFSLHPHGIKLSPDKHAPSRDDAPIADLGRFEAVLDRLTRAGRLRVLGGGSRFRLFLTEFGYQTRPPDRLLGVPPKTQRDWLVRGLQRAWRDPRVVNLTWYVWRDEPLGRNGSGWQSGLLYGDGREKPALAAFKVPFAATTRSVWGQVRPGDTHQVAVEARPRSGPYRAVTTLDTDAEGWFSAKVREPSWARYVRVRVVDATGLMSAAVRVRR